MTSNRRIRGMWMCFILVSLLAAVQGHAETLRAGFFNYPPYVMVDEDGTAIGPAIDYLRLIMKEMQVEDVSFEMLPMLRLLDRLKNGELDIGVLLSESPEREAMFTYPAQPFTSVIMALALKKSHPLQEIKSVDDLLPLTIGFFKGAYLHPLLKDTPLKFDYLSGDNWPAQNLKKVKAGRIDAALFGYRSMIFEAQKLGLSDELKFLPIPGTELNGYTVMSESCAKKYLRSYETALENVKKEKTFDQAFEEFLKSVK